MSDTVNKIYDPVEGAVVLKHINTSIDTYDHGEEEEEIEELGPIDNEARCLLLNKPNPDSSETLLQLSLCVKNYQVLHPHNPISTAINIGMYGLSQKRDICFGSHKRNQEFPDSMVAIKLVEEMEEGSSSSPFHSPAEDLCSEHEPGTTRDCDPLIRGPARKGAFHQFLNSVKSNSNQNNNNEETQKQRPGPLKDQSAEIQNGRPMVCSFGIILAAISCIFFATSALIVKVSVLHPMELLAIRGIIQWILVAPIVISSGNSFFGPKGSRSLLLARAILGSVSLIMSFASIHLIPLADAATVIFTSPVFVSIFACVCLGELCSLFDVAMIILTLVGVLLVSKPSFGFISSGSWEGIAGTSSGLAASMLTALAFIVLRQLKHVHYSVTVLWFSTVLAAFGTVLTIALDGFSWPTQWLSIVECVGIGMCGFFGQILLTKALQIENAGPVAVARTMDIVLAFIYQITLLHDTPDWYSYLGSVLVVSCVLLTALRKWYNEVHLTKRNDKAVGVDRIIS